MSADKPIPAPGGEKPIYDLDPVDVPAKPAPAVAPAAKADPLSEKPSLLDDFDEDADFTKDPEVESASTLGNAAKAAKRKFKFQDDVVPAPGETIVTAGRGSAKLWAGVASVLLLAAVIFCAINSKDHPVVNSVLVVYTALVHSVTGVAALAIAALVLGLKLGPLDLALARMLVCVSAFLLCSNLNIRLIGDGRWEELTSAALAYTACMWFLFRFDQRRLATVAILHFFLWIIFQIGMQLSVWAEKPLPNGL